MGGSIYRRYGHGYRESIYGKTSAEVAEKLRAVTASVDAGTYQEPQRMLLRDWLDVWLDEYCVEKYACHACEDGTEACKDCDHAEAEACGQCPNKPRMVVIAARLPEEFSHPLIKGSKASSSILSQIIYDKFDRIRYHKLR